MKRWIIPVTSVSVIIGALLSVQYKSQADARSPDPGHRLEDLAFMLKNTENANDQLTEQVTALQSRLQATKLPAKDDRPLYPTVRGPGLVVTITENASQDQTGDGTSAVVHAEDLLKIVNELRSGGAEAIALNGQRLTEVSEIITAGQHIVVNKKPIVAPYEILAIGPIQDMLNTLSLRGGVVEYLQFYGIQVKSKPEKSLVVPGVKHVPDLRYARPAPPPSDDPGLGGL
ncbi:MAG TPA: DUF881 domain-containing protein [Oscillatoriaceae cyanobacterium]